MKVLLLSNSDIKFLLALVTHTLCTDGTHSQTCTNAIIFCQPTIWIWTRKNSADDVLKQLSLPFS